MITASIAVYGMAAMTGSVIALVSVSARADADAAPSDRHEIPTFVRERVELATEADGWTRIAAPPPAQSIPTDGAMREAFP